MGSLNIFQLKRLLNSEKLDIFLLCETWLNNDITNTFLTVGTDFSVIRTDRSTGHIGGGVAAFIRNCLNFERISIPASNCEILRSPPKVG